MKLLMTCGGTGGHINPAIAIANTVKNNIPNAEILFVGTERGKEKELVPHEGYEIEFVESMGFRRPIWSPANIKAAYLAWVSPKKAEKLIRRFNPDIVIGTGGYACWPVLRAASRLGIPCAVHESNAIPGMAVKRLQNYVDKILVNFEKTGEYLQKREKVVTVGNPLRSAFSYMEKDAAKEKLGISQDEFFVLSYGGSGGAEYLNETVLLMMKEHGETACGVKLVHAAGSRDFKNCKTKYDEWGLSKLPHLTLLEYIYNMPLYMAAADLVICRAGAMTVSELAMMGKASIMIPSPNVVDDHQYKNAKMLADGGATCLMREAELTPSLLWENICLYRDNTEARVGLETAVRDFADPEANRRIFDVIMQLVGREDRK